MKTKTGFIVSLRVSLSGFGFNREFSGVETVETEMRFQNKFLVSNAKSPGFGLLKETETAETGKNCL